MTGIPRRYPAFASPTLRLVAVAYFAAPVFERATGRELGSADAPGGDDPAGSDVVAPG